MMPLMEDMVEKQYFQIESNDLILNTFNHIIIDLTSSFPIYYTGSLACKNLWPDQNLRRSYKT